MYDPTKMFDTLEMDEHALGCVEFVLSSPAYTDVFEPYLKSMRDALNRSLLDRTQKRKDEFSDDFIAGSIVTIDGLLGYFSRIIADTNMQRIHDSMANMTNDMLYEAKRQRGLVKPIVGLDQPANPQPYNEDEDF